MTIETITQHSKRIIQAKRRYARRMLAVTENQFWAGFRLAIVSAPIRGTDHPPEFYDGHKAGLTWRTTVLTKGRPRLLTNSVSLPHIKVESEVKRKLLEFAKSNNISLSIARRIAYDELLKRQYLVPLPVEDKDLS